MSIIIIMIYLFGFSSKHAVCVSVYYIIIVMCCHCVIAMLYISCTGDPNTSTKKKNKKSIHDPRLIFVSKTFQPTVFFENYLFFFSSAEGL